MSWTFNRESWTMQTPFSQYLANRIETNTGLLSKLEGKAHYHFSCHHPIPLLKVKHLPGCQEGSHGLPPVSHMHMGSSQCRTFRAKPIWPVSLGLSSFSSRPQSRGRKGVYSPIPGSGASLPASVQHSSHPWSSPFIFLAWSLPLPGSTHLSWSPSGSYTSWDIFHALLLLGCSSGCRHATTFWQPLSHRALFRLVHSMVPTRQTIPWSQTC